MAFLARRKKQDLVKLVEALDVTIGEKFKVLEIRNVLEYCNPSITLRHSILFFFIV